MWLQYVDVEPYVQWALRHNILLFFAEFMCALVVWGIIKLGFQHQSAKCRIAQSVPGAHEVGQFDTGYFTFLIIQTLPLLMTGLVIGDVFIIITRSGMLVAALTAYAMTLSVGGALDTKRIRSWGAFWVAVIMIGTMVWTQYPEVRSIVREWEKFISTISVVAMLLFLVKGQWSVAKQLLAHYFRGNTTNKRLTLQYMRLLYFVPQVIHYTLMPSQAEAFIIYVLGWRFDPILFNVWSGAVGVVVVIVLAMVGKLFTRKRIQKARLA